MSQEIKEANQPMFEAARELDLPLGHWAITSSGPMGIRGIRPINDIDIIVDRTLWDELEAKYGLKYVDGRPKINVPGDMFDINGYATYPEAEDTDPEKPSMEQQIKEADIIDGLPFVALRYTIYFKRQQGREKDLKDIGLIEEYLRSHPTGES